MKIILPVIFLFLFVINGLYAQSYFIYKGDTVNCTDINGLKQGLWIYFQGDENEIVSQCGTYIDSKKEGKWLTYYENGNLKSSITYLKNKQNGYAIIYYEDGTVAEEGIWKENRWTGEYKYFYPNGNPAYIWNFDDEGSRTGSQKYYYENGNLKIDGNWISGKEHGTISEYYNNGNIKLVADWNDGNINGLSRGYYLTGELKYEKYYLNGVLDDSSVAYYALNQNTNTTNIDTIYTVIIEKDSVATLFTGTGFHKLYNMRQLLEQEGYFKSGILVDGKKFIYNLEGVLIRTEIYESGKLTEIIK